MESPDALNEDKNFASFESAINRTERGAHHFMSR